MSSTPDFTYLSYIILFVLVIYFIILSVFLVIRRYEVHARMKNRPPPGAAAVHGYDDASFTFEWTTQVEEVADSIFGRKSRYLLMILRLFSALFFFGYGLIYLGNRAGSSGLFNYFDGWNMVFLFVYFSLATISSILLIRFSPRGSRGEEEGMVSISPEWSYQVRFVAVAARLMFEVSGTSSLLIIFGDLIGFSSSSSVAAVMVKTVNLVAMGLLGADLLLNQMKVRFDQYPASAAWLMVYLLIVWPSVFSRSLVDWPYSFLQTSSSSCFANYLLLFITSFCCHVVWFLIARGKMMLVLYLLFGRNGLHRDYSSNDRTMIELAEFHSHQSNRAASSSSASASSASGSEHGTSIRGGRDRIRDSRREELMTESFYSPPEDHPPSPPLPQHRERGREGSGGGGGGESGSGKERDLLSYGGLGLISENNH